MVITGPKRKKRLSNLQQRVKFIFVWPTDEGFMTLPEMSIRSGVPEQTLRTRIGRYGYYDERVFSTESLSKACNCTWENKAAPDIRHKCKRNRILCRSYHDCQSARLVMVGSPPWIEPEDTDKCYVPENAKKQSLTMSSLDGFSSIVFR